MIVGGMIAKFIEICVGLSVLGIILFCTTELCYMFILFIVVLIPFAFYNVFRNGFRWRK